MRLFYSFTGPLMNCECYPQPTDGMTFMPLFDMHFDFFKTEGHQITDDQMVSHVSH